MFKTLIELGKMISFLTDADDTAGCSSMEPYGDGMIFSFYRQWLRHISPHRNPHEMVGCSFKNTRCFDQGRYRFAPEVSDCFMSWSNFRAHLLNSKWGRSIVFDIGRLFFKNKTLIPHTATSRRLYLRVLPSFRHLCVLCTSYPLWILRFVFFVHAAFRAMLPSFWTRVGAAILSR